MAPASATVKQMLLHPDVRARSAAIAVLLYVALGILALYLTLEANGHPFLIVLMGALGTLQGVLALNRMPRDPASIERTSGVIATLWVGVVLAAIVLVVGILALATVLLET